MYLWWYPELFAGWAGAPHDRDAVNPAPLEASQFPDVPAGVNADKNLARLVAVALLNDPAITGGQMEVDVQHAVVILDGDVDTKAACTAAAVRAWSVQGVSDVCNALTVTGRRHRKR